MTRGARVSSVCERRGHRLCISSVRGTDQEMMKGIKTSSRALLDSLSNTFGRPIENLSPREVLFFGFGDLVKGRGASASRKKA